MDNPFFKDGKWFWYDEAGDLSKPYDTKKEAAKALSDYASWLDGEINKE
uniref:Uncharacterized protein n=1 Tax=viral metagenome TaxID=1070528 RepID=A0A6M3LSL7_9ZZZZ